MVFAGRNGLPMNTGLHISVTQGVNTTAFCTCTQALVPEYDSVDSSLVHFHGYKHFTFEWYKI